MSDEFDDEIEDDDFDDELEDDDFDDDDEFEARATGSAERAPGPRSSTSPGTSSMIPTGSSSMRRNAEGPWI